MDEEDRSSDAPENLIQGVGPDQVILRDGKPVGVYWKTAEEIKDFAGENAQVKMYAYIARTADTLPPSPADIIAASERVSPCCGAETILACCFCGHDLETNPIIYCSVCREYKIVPDLICSQCDQLISLG